MGYEILLPPGAAGALRALPAQTRGRVLDVLERHLRFERVKVSKSRIKRLRGLSRPQHRPRGDDIRVSDDVTQTTTVWVFGWRSSEG